MGFCRCRRCRVARERESENAIVRASVRMLSECRDYMVSSMKMSRRAIFFFFRMCPLSPHITHVLDVLGPRACTDGDKAEHLNILRCRPMCFGMCGRKINAILAVPKLDNIGMDAKVADRRESIIMQTIVVF